MGATIPRKRDLEVHFGPFLTIDFLREVSQGLSHQEEWRLCSALTQRIVEDLRDGVSTRFDLASVRAAWKDGALGPLVPSSQRPGADNTPALAALQRKPS